MYGGVTRAYIERCGAAYAQVSNKTTRGRTALEPSTWGKLVLDFIDARVYPLDLHMVQVVRLMLMSGSFYLGGKWANAGASS